LDSRTSPLAVVTATDAAARPMFTSRRSRTGRLIHQSRVIPWQAEG
jgi:hypothetical protein